MRRLLKFLHVLGAIGLIGSMLCLLVLLAFTPEPETIAEYARMRAAMGGIAKWILLPSLGLVLVGGLFAMAMTSAFHNAGWAWIKLATGILTFEWTLVAVQGPMQRQAELSARALAGELDPALIETLLHAERGSLWVLLAVALINVVLGVWRPPFSRPAKSTQSGQADTRNTSPQVQKTR